MKFFRQVLRYLFGSAQTGHLLPLNFLVDDTLEHILSYLQPREACVLSKVNRHLRRLFYLKHRHTLGSFVFPAFEGRSLVPLDRSVLSLLQIESNCFDVTCKERLALFNSSIFGVLLAVYDARIEGQNANVAISYLFEQMLVFRIDFKQTLRLCLHHDSNIEESQWVSLLHLLLVVAVESENVSLIHRILQIFPCETAQLLKQPLFHKSKDIKAVTEAVKNLFASDLELFRQIAFDPQTPNFCRLLFLRVTALCDLNCAILNEVFARLSIPGRIQVFAYLLEAEPCNQSVSDQIHLRNVLLFDALAPDMRVEDAYLFYTLNDWRFKGAAFDHERFKDELLQGPFNLFQIQLAKMAVATRQYMYLNDKYYPRQLGISADALKSDCDYWHLMEQDLIFNKVMNKRTSPYIILQKQYHVRVIDAYLIDNSFEKFLKRTELNLRHRLVITLVYAQSPKNLKLALRSTKLTWDITTRLFEWLLIIRGGREDIYDWIIEVFKIARKQKFRLHSCINSAIDLSPCPLSVVFKVLTYPKLHLFLKSSEDLGDYFKYFNEEAIFNACIRSDLHYEQFMRFPNLIRDLAPLFDGHGQGFHRFILRCNSYDSIQRLIELARLQRRAIDYNFATKHILKILRKNPVERIGSLKWALLFWRAHYLQHFNAECPEEWKTALDSKK